ncbi:hypothetical protein AWB76_00940 [Caballeronia temeraria]|uniref:Uncharacterized protein n=1 Tax=Caballeronia temeraria TaxID=1777137 RepID=A0A157ZM48_9BURK|nr:hypothetical protein [Caballeronia temeraria]SAK46590.1 hypothetical protein AWB76_00940 [Caballeronia temeraria]
MSNVNFAPDGILDTAIYTGEEARQLLNNPTLLKALDEIEQTATNEMVEALNPDVREQKWHLTRAVRELKKKLLAIQNAGTAAETIKSKRAKNGQK